MCHKKNLTYLTSEMPRATERRGTLKVRREESVKKVGMFFINYGYVIWFLFASRHVYEIPIKEYFIIGIPMWILIEIYKAFGRQG